MRRLAASAVLCAACAGASATRPQPAEPPRAVSQGTLASGAEGGFETGRLASVEQSVAGPFVLTYLAPGAELEVVTAAGALGRLAGPLAQPFHLATGSALRLAAPGEAVYAGHRPMPITRALDAFLGRPIRVAIARAAPEEWSLRGIGADHLTIERSRTYRVIPVRRIAEITWTDLTGIDPRPLVVLAPE